MTFAQVSERLEEIDRQARERSKERQKIGAQAAAIPSAAT